MSSAGVETFLQAFDRLSQQRAGEPGWLRALRRAAIERFAAHGFPTTKLEDWKYTSVREIAEGGFAPEAAAANGFSRADALAELGPDFRGPVLAFVNGRFARALSRPASLPGGARAGSLRDALEGDPGALEDRLGQVARFDHPAQAFAALNTAFLDDGAFVYVPRGAALEQPIGIVFLSAANGASAPARHPRVLILAEEGAHATIVECHGAPHGGRHLTNAVSEVAAGAGAQIVHLRLQDESSGAFHVGALRAAQERDSSFRSHAISIGAALARHDVGSLLEAEGTEAELHGLFVAGDGQHVDHHTEIDHARPHGRSLELYKGILGGRARGVFNGKIVVRPDAQKTDARQSNPNLLISDRAHIHTKPQLEIHADDVRCSHGSTIGHLDEHALFYLRSRGIDAPAARSLLTRAFASEIGDALPVPALRSRVAAILLERISPARDHVETT